MYCDFKISCIFVLQDTGTIRHCWRLSDLSNEKQVLGFVTKSKHTEVLRLESVSGDVLDALNRTGTSEGGKLAVTVLRGRIKVSELVAEKFGLHPNQSAP